MSSPIQPNPEALMAFSQKLNELPGNASKVLSVMESILNENTQIPLEGDLAKKVTELREMLSSSGRVNTAGVASLRGELEGALNRRVRELRSLVAVREQQMKLWHEILTEIPPNHMSSFMDTVEGFYRKAILGGISPKEALPFALGKGIVRSMVRFPSPDEIEANQELQDKIKDDESLKNYICPISHTLVGSDAVYLRADEHGNPRERYHEDAIRGWIVRNHTDPMSRDPVQVGMIKPDPKAREFIKNKVFALLYPELVPEVNGTSLPVEALQGRASLLALAATYAETKKRFAEGLRFRTPNHGLIEAAEGSARDLASRFIFLAEGMDRELEGMPFSCFLVVEKLLKSAEKKLTSRNWDEIKFELKDNLETLIRCYHEIEKTSISPYARKKALEVAGAAIGDGASLTEVRDLIAEYVKSLREENEIRNLFPGCLIGAAEWDLLGEVENLPLPEGILETLSEPCPVTPGKKVGETHLLVLIPDKVGEDPLTLNSLGGLVKSKGHFPRGQAPGYGNLDTDVASAYGNKKAGSSHWVLMTRDVLPESRGKSYKDQKAMVEKLVYEVPELLSAAACVFLHYLSSGGERLFGDDPQTYTRCQGWGRGPRQVMMGKFSPGGFRIMPDFMDYEPVGVAMMRKL